tara:strand:+ start:242 stop:382 length:141 start_codon:yes stop_codon:yes gene_type:complete
VLDAHAGMQCDLKVAEKHRSHTAMEIAGLEDVDNLHAGLADSYRVA